MISAVLKKKLLEIGKSENRKLGISRKMLYC